MHNRSLITAFLWTLCIAKGHTITCGLSGHNKIILADMLQIMSKIIVSKG